MRKISLLLLWAALLAAPAAAQEDSPASGPYRSYEPSWRSFRCQVRSDWRPLEEETAQGHSVHFLGPEDSAAAYRAGIDVHVFEPGQPGFVQLKKALELMRRDEKDSDRHATPIRMLRSNGLLFRLFEVTETRRLPSESLPSSTTALHHYTAVFQSGESYFLLRLSSTRQSYLDYRDEFLRFLKHFQPLGYK